MKEKDFLHKMENLKKPEVDADASRRQMRVAIINSRKSAAWGIWLLILPVLFLKTMVIKEFLGWDWGVINTVQEWFGTIDNKARWVSPVLFLVLPAIALVLNLLAIMHFLYDKSVKQLIVSIKVKWVNIIIVLISAGILKIVALYVIMENSAERAIHKMEQTQIQRGK